MTKQHLIEKIDALLPQTQCGECEFKGCKPYAEAMVLAGEPIDKCAPGGLNTLHQLADILNIDPKPYEKGVKARERKPSLAKIREQECIGCTKCINACPVDAIIGSSKMLHTIIEHECTGCNLCIEPCPVDCIDIIPLEESQFDRETAKTRFMARNQRLENKQKLERNHYQQKSQSDNSREDIKAKQAYILEALKRRQKK